MNEFNPFDELWITFDDDWLQETRRDRNYKNKYNPFDMNKDIKVDLNTQPEYQPDFSQSLTNMNNPKDLQVAQELWIMIPEPMMEKEKQAYVDALSDEDWEIWQNLKDEWYSFEARKAMFDNREDLYDITEAWNKKFWSWNKNSFMQYLLDDRQDTVDFQEDVIHPWSQRIEDWLNVQSADLMNYSYDEIKQEMYNNAADPNDNNLVKWMRKQAVKPLASVKRWAAIAWWILFDLASKGVNLLDNLGNISTQLWSWWLNSIADERKGYDLIINDPEKEPTIYWSYVEWVADTMGIAFTSKFPIATWILTTIWSESDALWWLMEAANNWIEWVWKRVDEKTWIDKFNLKYLTPEEQEIFYNNQATATWILFAEATGEWFNKLSKTEAYQRLQQAIDYAKKTSKVGLREWVKEVQETKQIMEQQPEWTEFRTEWWTKVVEVTSNGVQTTPYWALRILQKLGGRQINWWIRWFEWFYKNKNKLVTRDPNAPVWELPVVDIPEVKTEDWVKTPTEEIKETPKEEIKTPESWVKTTSKPVAKKVESSENQTIWEYIKKISNEISGKKGGMDKDLFEKFSSSPDLQNEYINTIDPYIRANGWEDPAWVIENQLNDFIETAKEQLQDRRNNNIDFRKWQMKYKVQIPESDKVKWEQDDKEIKNLIKILSKQSTDPEKFLNYLLNLPEEKIQGLNKFIPNFSKNLELIKDTLALTKAITSKDLLGKFLQYKSTWWTRRKNFIRRYLWKKINEAYKKAWIQRNMYEIENIINNMSEEELVQLENEIDNWWIRPYMSDAEFADLLDKWYTPWTWIPADQNIQEIMDSKRPWTNKTTREYLKEKWVQISLTDERWLQKIGWNIQAAYSAKLDRILMKSEKNPYKWIVYHEFGHRVLAQLGTTEIMDIITHIAKRDWITQDAAFERRAEYFRNYLQYNNIDWKKYLIKNLGDDIASKINATMEKTKEEIWDLFDLNEWDKNINQILSDVKHDTPKGKDITSRRPEPLIKEMVPDSAPVRYEYLRTIDPNIEAVEIYPYFDKPIQIRFKDGSTQRWTEYRKTLTSEQLKEIDTYETDIVREFVDEQTWRDKWFKWEWKFNYDTLQNEKDLTSLLMDESFKSFQQTKESLWLDAFETVNYLKSLQNIDPDILGIFEKDGQLYVKYRMESQWERYELPDRPGYVEVKEVPAKDYFTEDELNQLPKDLVAKIKKNAN